MRKASFRNVLTLALVVFAVLLIVAHLHTQAVARQQARELCELRDLMIKNSHCILNMVELMKLHGWLGDELDAKKQNKPGSYTGARIRTER